MSRTDNTLPHQCRTTWSARTTRSTSRAMRRNAPARAAAWWGAVRAAEREALVDHSDPPPATRRHRALWESR